MTDVKFIVFCVVSLEWLSYSVASRQSLVLDFVEDSRSREITPPHENLELPSGVELVSFEEDSLDPVPFPKPEPDVNSKSEEKATSVEVSQVEEHINHATTALTPSTTTYLKNGGAQTRDILSTLLRNIDKTEDDLEAVKKSIYNLVRNINPVGEDQLIPSASKIKKYSVIVYLKANWRLALKHCKQRGMELATIENESEQRQLEAIVDEIDFHIFPFWISASDITTEGVFTWGISGKPATYSKWDSDQPDGERSENCVALIQTGEGYFWDDRGCSNNFNFVCQYFDESPNHRV